MADQSFFHGVLGWDDWIWWSAIGAVGLFLLMLMLCCCVCMRRAKTKGRREAIAQANIRRREREQQQRSEQQYAQARQQQLAQQRESNQFKYPKPEPPAQQAYVPPQQYPLPMQQPQQQKPPYGTPVPPYHATSPQQYRGAPTYGQQSPFQQQQVPYQPVPAYQQPPAYNQDPYQQQQQQPKFYPPPASPPPPRQTQTYQDPAPVPLPPTRQMYEGGGTAARYTGDNRGNSNSIGDDMERRPSSPTASRRFQNRSYTHPDQPALLQYGQRKNSRTPSTSHPSVTGTTLSTQDTFNAPDASNANDDLPFIRVTSPTGMPLGGYAPEQPRDSNTSGPPRSSTHSKASSASSRPGRGQTLQERIEALRTGGVQDNHTRISLESEQPSNVAVASTATTSSGGTESTSPEPRNPNDKQSLFQRQLAASSGVDDDSFISGGSSIFGSSFASTESQDVDAHRNVLTPRDDLPQRRPATSSLDSRESVEF